MENACQYPHLSEPDKKIGEVDGIPAETEKIKQRTVARNHLVNKLNFINFQDGTVLVNFKHPRFDRVISLRAKPEPCIEDILECVWVLPNGNREKVKAYRFQDLHVPDGHKLLCVVTDKVRVTAKGIRLRLPESCLEFRARKRLRHDCTGIHAQLIQNSVVFNGRLIDFTARSFRVEVTALPPQTFQWFNSKSTITVVFSNGPETLYAGECRIIRQTLGQRTRTFVLESLNQSTHRFSPKQFRSSRYQLVPSPDVLFKHPLTQKLVCLNVVDLSGSGLSVEEDEGVPVLLPGMMIPEMELSFASSFSIPCRSQVINKKIIQEDAEEPLIVCGMVFLDMDPGDHSKLLAVLNQAKDKNSYISNRVDPEALWDFFFETGFIYPEKYAFVQSNKEKIKSTYEKLYTQSPSIARHFVYQDNGRILGHMSMVRFVGNSWMIHHHAANTAVHNQAGIQVLCQINHYCNDTYKMYSSHLDLVFCYFRPQNKFPLKVFGGSARYIKDHKRCSVDTYAYLHCQKIFNNDLDLPEPWQLVKTLREDLIELETFYEHVSGGLMLNALGLEPNMLDQNDVSEVYQQLGFRRDRHLYSLKKKDKLKAVAVVNMSDIGLNLSHLTDCIHFIVLDSGGVPKDIFYSSLSMLSTKYEQSEMPVLLYPLSYADSEAIEYEKQYTLWALNLQFSDGYLEFINRLLRRY
jgi:hypothetical protein